MSDLNFYLDSSVTDLRSGSLSVKSLSGQYSQVTVAALILNLMSQNTLFKFHFLSVCPQFVLSTESLHYSTGILEL